MSVSTVLFRYAEFFRKGRKMYEIFEKLCKMRGITPYRFCEDTGVGTSTISTWKKNNSQCRPKLAKIVCEYFGISHDYLMTGEETRFTVEQANLDVQLARQQKRIKEYMLKFANLSDDKRNQIMSLIDMLEEK